jgi:hypothetical protein
MQQGQQDLVPHDGRIEAADDWNPGEFSRTSAHKLDQQHLRQQQQMIAGASERMSDFVSCVSHSERPSPEDMVVVCSVCEEQWPTARLEDHSELCAVLRQVRVCMCECVCV